MKKTLFLVTVQLQTALSGFQWYSSFCWCCNRTTIAQEIKSSVAATGAQVDIIAHKDPYLDKKAWPTNQVSEVGGFAMHKQKFQQWIEIVGRKGKRKRKARR